MKAIISDALNSLCPNSHYIIVNNDYDQITWLEPPVHQGGRKKPSRQEIEEEIKKIQQKYDDTEYQRLRSPEYPNLTEFADAFYWMQKGNTTKMDEYISKCDAIKQKYPKPEGIQ